MELTFPQALQWCRLSVRLKSVVQFMHIITWETGTSTGAASPRAIHSFSRACGYIAVRTVFKPGVRSWKLYLKNSPSPHCRARQMCRVPQRDRLWLGSACGTSPLALQLNWRQKQINEWNVSCERKTYENAFHCFPVRFPPGWQCNGDVRNFNPETVQHIIDDRFGHLWPTNTRVLMW